MERRRFNRRHRSSLSYVQPELPVDVTLLAESGSPHAYETPLYFNETNLGELMANVKAFHSQWPDGLVVIVAELIEPARSWRAAPVNGMDEPYADLKTHLSKLTAHRFPKHIINSVINRRARQPYVPGEADGIRGNAAWVLKYHGGNGVFPNHPRPSSDEAINLLKETTWIGAWVGCRESVLDQVPGKRPLVEPPMAVIIFPRDEPCAPSDHHYYGKKMINQYKMGTTKYWWRCVLDQPLFLFMDLHRLFNNFKSMVATADWEVNQKMEPDTYGSRHRVIPRVERLREALIRLAEFRQELKTYEIAKKSMEKIVQHHVEEDTYKKIDNNNNNKNNNSNNKDVRLDRFVRNQRYQSARLCDRLYDLGNDLETSNLHVDMLREQCMYLMDSEFNTVAARTDARLGILTVLAFVLTPAGFVVSLFSVIDSGTMQLIVSAVLVAFFSVLIYVVVDRVYRSAEQTKLESALALERDGLYGDEKRKRYR